MTRKKTFFRPKPILMLFLALFLLTSCSQKSTLKINWESDLLLVKQQMPQREITLKLNSRLAKDFDDRMNELLIRLPEYKNDDQVKIKLSEVVASVQQLHTNLDLGDEPKIPFKLYEHQGKLFVTDTLPDYEDVLYMELIEINHHKVSKIMEEVSKVVSVDNDNGLNVGIPSKIISYTVLHGLGVIKEQNKVELTFQRENGERIPITAVMISEYDPSLRLINPHQDSLLYKKLGVSNYGHTYLSEETTLYIAYNSCEEDTQYSMKKFTQDVMVDANKFPVSKIIIDLRSNGGGDSNVIQPLISELILLPKSKQHVLVLIGRNSASSAILNAIQIQTSLHAKLIGEAPNGDPNKPGDILPLELPESGLTIFYSTKLLDRNPNTLEPDVPIDYTIEDFILGNDPVLNAALAYRFNN